MDRTNLIHWYCLLQAQHSQYALSDPGSVIEKARVWADKLLNLEVDIPDLANPRWFVPANTKIDLDPPPVDPPKLVEGGPEDWSTGVTRSESPEEQTPAKKKKGKK